MMRLRRELQVLLIMVCGLVLVGCNDEELYANLTEQEANEIVALMYAADMPAEKRVDKDETFTVTTSKNAFPEAMALLQSQGLPREQFDSLGEVFQKEGFVSSPLEERARLNHALSQEISRTIASIDGVVQARVHLAVPEKQQLEKNTAPSSASVFVKHRPDVNLGMNVGKIKAMVINSVEGLPYDNVTVALFPQEPYKLPDRQALDVSEDSPFLEGGVQLGLPVLMVLAGLTLVGVVLWRFSLLRKVQR